jgi:hypothetical protein
MQQGQSEQKEREAGSVRADLVKARMKGYCPWIYGGLCGSAFSEERSVYMQGLSHDEQRRLQSLAAVYCPLVLSLSSAASSLEARGTLLLQLASSRLLTISARVLLGFSKPCTA